MTFAEITPSQTKGQPMHDSLPEIEDSAKINTTNAVRFLKEISSKEISAPECVSVCAIDPNGGISGADTFLLPQGETELHEWLERRNGVYNLYYALNEPVIPILQINNGRINERDVSRIRGVAVDIDPQKGANLEAERSRILETLVDFGRDGPKPTYVVDSGGGFQAIWLFEDPIKNLGDAGIAVKAQAKALQKRLGGDSTQSLDHLFRIPGTVNIPNQRKRANGRKVAVASVVDIDLSRRTTLAELSAAVAPAPAHGGTETAASAAGGFDSKTVLDAAYDRRTLPEHLVDIACEIERSKSFETTKQKDRSTRDFAVACQCVERGLTDPTEIGQVTFSLCPEKAEEKDAQGNGDSYVRHTVFAALQAARRPPRVEDWFAPLSDEGPTHFPPIATASRKPVVVKGLVNPRDIKTREWLIFPRVPLDGVTLCVGEPGVSKSTFAIRDALCVATGRAHILSDNGNSARSQESLHKSGAVLIYNAEDPIAEIERRLASAQRHFGIAEADMKHGIVLWSGVDHDSLTLMRREKAGAPLVQAKGADLLAQTIAEHRVALAILDPQISLADGIDENSNPDLDALYQTLARIGRANDCAIMVVHHTAKATRQARGDMGAGRGGFAAAGKARSVFTLTNVKGDAPDEKEWGVSPSDRFIRLDSAKQSYAPITTKPIVLRRISVPVGNGSQQAGTNASQIRTLFDCEAGEAHRRAGDFAPVLDVVDVEAMKRNAKAGAAIDANGTKAIADAAFDTLGESDEKSLASILGSLTGRLSENGVVTATSRAKTTTAITAALGAGVLVSRGEQHWVVMAHKDGTARNAPWVVRRCKKPAAKPTNDEGLSP